MQSKTAFGKFQSVHFFVSFGINLAKTTNPETKIFLVKTIAYSKT